MAISNSLLSSSSFIRSDLLIQNQDRLADLNRQLATGERSQTYGGLGVERNQSISLRQDISQLEAFQSNIQRLDIRVEITGLSLERLEALRIEARDAINPNNFIDLGNGQTFTQATADALLTESFALLNTQSDGRYVFSGNQVNTRPLEELDIVLNGDGVRAGLRQVTDERLAADLGVSGLGRLDVTRATDTVSITEDAATNFGFDLSTVNSGLSNVTAAISGTEPANLDVQFTGQPQVGESLQLFLDLPDGSRTSVEVFVSSFTTDDGGFTLGATPEETAQNFQTAIANQLQFEARTELNAVSRIEAAESFFNTGGGQAPLRVDTLGSPETAIGLVAGTPADTVEYYLGQNDADNPRAGITTRVDENITVQYGLRANEDALRAGITSLAAFAIADFTTGPDEQNQAIHSAFASRTSRDLSVQVESPSIQSAIQEVVGVQVISGNADLRHAAAIDTLNGIREDVEAADPTEVAVQLLSLQTQIEASFTASSRINELSLIDFI